MSKIIIAIIIIIVITALGYWIYQSTIPPKEEAVSEGSKDCVNDDDCIVFGETGDCNCGCYNKSNLPTETGGECFCLSPNSCKCVDGKCEGVFKEEVTTEEKGTSEEQEEVVLEGEEGEIPKEEEKKEEGPREVSNTTRWGIIYKDEIWSGEIFVPGMVEVPKGVTLTVKPGTVVKFRHSRDYKNLGGGHLLINGGVLKAIGTPTEPIWFTSDAEEPINGDWVGIFISESKHDNIIKYSIVEYAFIGITFWTSSGTVTNSIVRWITAEGIYMERSNPVIENNTIYGTGYNGIAMEQFNDVIIENNKIINNGGSGIQGIATKAIVQNNIVRNSSNGIGFDQLCDVTLRNNLMEGIHNDALHFYLDCSGSVSFNEITTSGVGISSFGSSLTAHNNDIYNNTKNIEIHSMQEVNLEGNWWGTTDRIAIEEKINSDTEVSFEPFLDEECVNIQEPVFDYQDVKKTDLGYIPGDPEDKYPYIYAEEDETRRIIKKICGADEGFVGKGIFGWSLAWDGEYLWRTRHAGSADLIKINPENCEIIVSFENPGIAQDRGIAFDGQSLWVNDFTALKVFEISPETGEILSSFEIPEMGSGSSGIAWDGEYLYLVDWLKRNQPGAPLYKVDRQGNLIDTIYLEKGGGASITFDGQYFWVSPSAFGKGILKYDKNGKLAGEIYSVAFGGEAIAHDGEYLWVLHRTQELWNDPKLYKIEILDDSLK